MPVSDAADEEDSVDHGGRRYVKEKPYQEVEALAGVLIPEIQAFFEREEGQREFDEWTNQWEHEQQK